MKKFSSIIVCALILAGICSVASAATVTNSLGGVTTVTLLEEVADAGTVVKDQSVYATPTDRRGIHVVHYEVPAAGLAVGAHDIGTVNLPKGSILLDSSVIEVQTAVLPAGSTNTLAIGSVNVLATGTTLNATGIDAAVPTPGITTAADKLAITVAGNAATSGVFTVYLKYIMGNAQ